MEHEQIHDVNIMKLRRALSGPGSVWTGSAPGSVQSKDSTCVAHSCGL